MTVTTRPDESRETDESWGDSRVDYARIRNGVAVAAFAIIVWCGGVSAQNPGAFNASARAGVAFPAGDLWQVQDPGANLGAALAYYFHPNIAVRGEFSASFLSEITDTAGQIPSPAWTMLHFNGGVEFHFNRYKWQDFPLTFLVAVGAGATSASAEKTFDDDSSVDFSETAFTANGAAEVGWQFNQSVNVFLAGYAYAMKFNAEDTAVFAERSTDVEAFDWVWSFPLTLGVRLSVQ